ncbi:MAG: EscU/YscU/HrcU family type III secretion system export apparatus switch protein [Pseudomonadota bacterium]
MSGHDGDRNADARGKRAIALRYDGTGAPVVTAAGDGELGERIRALAAANGVPIYKDTGLAALLSEVDLGEEIPEALYLAVAEVIAFAWTLSAEQENPPETTLPVVAR